MNESNENSPDTTVDSTEQATPMDSRVLDLSHTETFKVTTLVLAFDRLPTHFPKGARYEVENPVPVYHVGEASGTPIGHASVAIDERQITANLFLVRDCPERLDIENKLVRLWPNGIFFMRPDGVIEVKSISITTWEQRGYPAIGEPIL